MVRILGLILEAVLVPPFLMPDYWGMTDSAVYYKSVDGHFYDLSVGNPGYSLQGINCYLER